METANQNLLLTNEVKNFENKVNKSEDKVEKKQGVQFTVFYSNFNNFIYYDKFKDVDRLNY